MNNGLDPEKMTGPERLEELSLLLAVAMLRISRKRRKERISKDNCLGFDPETRLHVTVE